MSSENHVRIRKLYDIFQAHTEKNTQTNKQTKTKKLKVNVSLGLHADKRYNLLENLDIGNIIYHFSDDCF
jgi:hypothetical protein